MHNDASAGLEHDGLDGGEPGGGVLGSSPPLMAGHQPCKPPGVQCHPQPGSQGGREVDDGTTGSFPPSSRCLDILALFLVLYMVNRRWSCLHSYRYLSSVLHNQSFKKEQAYSLPPIFAFPMGCSSWYLQYYTRGLLVPNDTLYLSVRRWIPEKI